MVKSFISKIKNRQVLYFVFKLIAFLLIIITIDYTVGNILKYYYFKQESGVQYRTSYSINKTDAGILIFGSSRANHHYCPDKFEKAFNSTYYNVGSDGNFIFYHYAILKSILKRYTPKIIILDFNMGEFKTDTEAYDRITALLPYYKSHPELRSIIELKSKYEKLKLLSNIYPYNSLIFKIAVGNSQMNKKRKADRNGYVPLNGIWKEPIKKGSIFGKYKIDSIKVQAYENFVKDCHDKGVKLCVIVSPSFINTSISDSSISIAKVIAQKNGSDFYDFTNDSMFISEPNLFFDIIHLNDTGAEIFSSIVVDKLINDKLAIKAENELPN